MKRTHKDNLIWLVASAIIFFLGGLFLPAKAFSCLVFETGAQAKAEALGVEANQKWQVLLAETPEGWDQYPDAFEKLKENIELPFGFRIAGEPRNPTIQCWLDGSWAAIQPGYQTSGAGWLPGVMTVLSFLVIMLGAGVIGWFLSFLIPEKLFYV